MKLQLSPIALAVLIAVLLTFGPHESSARPTAGVHRRVAVVAADLPPKLSDTLAVAKSPLEPITMAPSQPGARNDGEPAPLTTVSSVSAFKPATDEQPNHKQTTRETSQTDYEQQQSSTSTKGLDESTGLADSIASGSTRSVVSTELPDESAPTTTTESPLASTGLPVVTETETKAAESGPANTTVQTAPVSSSTTPPVREEDADKLSAAPTTTTTTTEAPTTSMPSTTTEKKEPETSTNAESITTTTDAPVPTTQDITTSAPATTTTNTPVAIEVSSEAAIEESGGQPTTTSTTTTTTPTPEPEPVSTNQPTTTGAPELQREQTTTTAKPATTTIASSVESITTAGSVEPIAEPATTTTTSTTTTAKPTVAPEDEEAKLSACDHLPTYKSDEVQKVFREETTFKNGTIKGKFTYINFDQRYRLVHYTRLPYGPVKIDHVEELGRPNGQNRSSVSALNDVPNAVLQLRNLLPNSLFGFPFLGPNSAGQARPTAIGPREGAAESDVDKSNMYFYSTDSLATPNLLTPRVPVSLLPGQRVRLTQTAGANSASQAAAAADPLGSSYLEHSLVASAPRQGNEQQSANQGPHMGSIFGMPSGPMDSSSSFSKSEEFLSDISRDAGQRNHNQFHYANMMDGQPETKSLAYSYYSSNAHPIHYQYAPVSSSLFGNPLYQAQQQHSPVESQGMIQPPSHLLPHQAHQPHSHEHYMSQYMLSSPAAIRSEPIQDNARLRLRVKTSKALNVNRDGGTKSAQLRMQPSDGHYSAPAADSPMQVLHQRNQHRRLGKQNHQLKSTPANHSPVVYHVLRNPAGRSFGQYNQGYAVAYDHDN